MRKNRGFKNNLGFTLIELMITVGIIAILTGLLFTILDPQGLRAKARDKQRMSDLKKIQSALEMYYQEHRSYPENIGWNSPPSVLTEYIDPIPEDPINSGGQVYGYTSDSQDYCLIVFMEEDSSGNGCTHPECSGVGSSPECYGITNP